MGQCQPAVRAGEPRELILILPPERGSVSRSHVWLFETLPPNPNAFQAAKPLRVTDPRSDYRAFALGGCTKMRRTLQAATAGCGVADSAGFLPYSVLMISRMNSAASWAFL